MRADEEDENQLMTFLTLDYSLHCMIERLENMCCFHPSKFINNPAVFEKLYRDCTRAHLLKPIDKSNAGNLAESRIREIMHEFLRTNLEVHGNIIKEYPLDDGGCIDLVIKRENCIACAIVINLDIQKTETRKEKALLARKLMQSSPTTERFPIILFDGFNFELMIAGFFTDSYRPYFHNCRQIFPMFAVNETRETLINTESFRLFWLALHCSNPMAMIKLRSERRKLSPEKIIGLSSFSIVLLCENKTLKFGVKTEIDNEHHVAMLSESSELGLKPELFSSNYGAVLRYPRGYPVVKSLYNTEIKRIDLEQLEILFDKLLTFHSLGFIHKDVRPENITLVEESDDTTKMSDQTRFVPYLVDFDSFIFQTEEETEIRGTIGTASQRILLEAVKQATSFTVYHQEDDLESFLKTFILLDGKEELPMRGKSIAETAQVLYDFWKGKFLIQSFLKIESSYDQKALFIKRLLAGPTYESDQSP